jgi:hypothetical protein
LQLRHQDNGLLRSAILEQALENGALHCRAST